MHCAVLPDPFMQCSCKGAADCCYQSLLLGTAASSGVQGSTSCKWNTCQQAYLDLQKTNQSRIEPKSSTLWLNAILYLEIFHCISIWQMNGSTLMFRNQTVSLRYVGERLVLSKLQLFSSLLCMTKLEIVFLWHWGIWSSPVPGSCPCCGEMELALEALGPKIPAHTV